MKVFHGTATYEGIAIGKVQYLRKNEQHIRQYTVENARREIRRFQKAKEKTLDGLKFMLEQMEQEFMESEAKILRRRIKLLEDGSFARAIESQVLSEKVNAAYAIITTRDEIARTFAKMNDEVVRNRITDIKDISNRMILMIEGIAREDYANMEPVIVVANNLSPTEVMEMDQNKLLAFVSREGSPVSHTAIISKTLSIPALIGIEVDPSWEDKMAIVDGYEGAFYLEPTRRVLEKYQEMQQKEQQDKEFLMKLRNMEDVTLDGTKVRLYANIRS